MSTNIPSVIMNCVTLLVAGKFNNFYDNQQAAKLTINKVVKSYRL